MTTSDVPGKVSHAADMIICGSVSVALLVMGIIAIGTVVYSLFAS